jgi:hypothetical protein
MDQTNMLHDLHPLPEAMQDPGQIRQAPLQTAQRIEIMFGRLKDRWRVATRYNRCPKAFFSAIALAAVVICWL